MKVAVICPDDLSIVLFCKGIVQVLKDWDNSQVLVISDYWSEDEDGFYIKTIKSWGVEHVPLKMSRYVTPWEDIKYVYSLWLILKTNKINVVVNISTKPNIYGTIAAKLAGVRRILCSVWGRGSVFVDRPGFKNQLLRALILILFRVAFTLSTKVWFTNVNDCNYFLTNNIVARGKVILTKNYVSTDDYFPYTLSPDRLSTLRNEFDLNHQSKVVIMVARMIWAKGVKEFVDASKLLRERHPLVKFILVGPKEEGNPDVVPESYLREGEKSGNFRWVGFRRDVKDLYALADVAVLPTYYKEGGFPRALTEPMAMGKPVITTDSVDCRAVLEEGKNGYLVPIRDPKALADAIEVLMNDDKKRKEFGRYSRLKAENEFDEKVIVQQVFKEFL
jgi:N,N'-diacetylbacillosaminyl-diphospho-undecaprenol alpha-1,3-N-acetylgalactosaminyltransferase